MEKNKQFVTHTLNTEYKHECAEAVIIIYLQITFHQTHFEMYVIKRFARNKIIHNYCKNTAFSFLMYEKNLILMRKYLSTTWHPLNN